MISEEKIREAFKNEGIKTKSIGPLETCSLVILDARETISIENLLNVANELGIDPGVVTVDAGLYELEILI